jgi:hypothetical protein
MPRAGIEPDPRPYYQGFKAIDLQHTYNLGHISQGKIHKGVEVHPYPRLMSLAFSAHSFLHSPIHLALSVP